MAQVLNSEDDWETETEWETDTGADEEEEEEEEEEEVVVVEDQFMTNLNALEASSTLKDDSINFFHEELEERPSSASYELKWPEMSENDGAVFEAIPDDRISGHVTHVSDHEAEICCNEEIVDPTDEAGSSKMDQLFPRHANLKDAMIGNDEPMNCYYWEESQRSIDSTGPDSFTLSSVSVGDSLFHDDENNNNNDNNNNNNNDNDNNDNDNNDYNNNDNNGYNNNNNDNNNDYNNNNNDNDNDYNDNNDNNNDSNNNNNSKVPPSSDGDNHVAFDQNNNGINGEEETDGEVGEMVALDEKDNDDKDYDDNDDDANQTDEALIEDDRPELGETSRLEGEEEAEIGVGGGDGGGGGGGGEAQELEKEATFIEEQGNNANSPKEQAAAVEIQRNIRGFLARKHVSETAAAIAIQKNFRGFQSRKHSQEEGEAQKREEKPKAAKITPIDSAAIKIQSQFRSFKAAKELGDQKKAAVLIQKSFRGFQTRKKFEEGGVEAVISPTKHVGDRCRCSPETPELSPSPVRPDPALQDPLTVTVVFPEELKMQILTTKGATIKDVRNLVARHLVFRGDLLTFTVNEWSVDHQDDEPLLSLLEFPRTTSTLLMRVDSKDPLHIRMPPLENPTRLFKVRIDVLGMPTRVLLVEMVRDFRRKFFLGGFRSKVSGVEFHHAVTQTPRPTRIRQTENLNHRETQTAELVSVAVDTVEETSTQMTKIGAYVTIGLDRIMFASDRYVTADEYHAMLVTKAIVIQKYWRRWLAVRRVKRLREQLERKRRWEAEERLRRKKEKEERLRSEFDRRMNPKTKADFDILYSALEKWRQGEMKQIDATLTGAERKAELCRLMDQETEYINAIGKHENQAKLLARTKNVEKFLSMTSSSKCWSGPDGRKTHVDTPNIIWARKLKDLYHSVCLRKLRVDERLDVLLRVKEVVSPHKCKLTQDVLGLIDRESDLLMRGIMKNNMEALRKRIQTAFLQFIRDPRYNPEAAKHHRVPQDASALRRGGGTHMCPTCQSYRPIHDFRILSNSVSTGKCLACIQRDNIAHPRIDFGFYGVLLKQLKTAEEKFDDDSRICHLLKEPDIKYLVDEVWKTRSALSLHDDIYDLILLRWNQIEEWSPWNCVVLTKVEAAAHKLIEEPKLHYDAMFLRKVAAKHDTARKHFLRLPWLVKYLKMKTTKKARDAILAEENGAMKGEARSCRVQRNNRTKEKRLLHEMNCGHTIRDKSADAILFVAASYGEKKLRLKGQEG